MPSITNINHAHFVVASALVILAAVIMLAWRFIRRRRARGRPAPGEDNSNQ